MLDVLSPWFWFSLAGILGIIELIGTGFFFAIFFAIAAVVTGILSFFIHSISLLLIFFGLTALLGVILCRPLLEKKLKINKTVRESAVGAIIGQKGIVTKEITSHEKGYVKIQQDSWAASSINNDVIPVGTEIIVRDIKGVTAFVENFKNESEGE